LRVPDLIGVEIDLGPGSAGVVEPAAELRGEPDVAGDVVEPAVEQDAELAEVEVAVRDDRDRALGSRGR